MTHKSTSKLPSVFDDNYERFNSKNNLLDNININNSKQKFKRYQTRKAPNKINNNLI